MGVNGKRCACALRSFVASCMQVQATLGSPQSKLKILLHRRYPTLPGPIGDIPPYPDPLAIPHLTRTHWRYPTLPGPVCTAMASEQGPSRSYTGAADDDGGVDKMSLNDFFSSTLRRKLMTLVTKCLPSYLWEHLMPLH